VRGEQSEALFDRRRRCLDRRRRDLVALLDVLHDSDAAVLDRAPEAVRSLRSVARCDDPEFVSAQVEPPSAPDLAEEVEALRDRVAHIDAMRNGGRADEALAEGMAALGEARALAYPPIVAELLLAAGQAADSAGDPVTAEPLLREAYLGALRQGLDDVAAGAATRLVYTVGHGLSRLADAREWAAHASALLDRPGTDPLRRTALLNHEAAVAWHHGDYARAEAGFQEVLARWREAHGPRSAQVAIALSNLGALAYARGEADAAIAAYGEVLSITRERVGEDHPDFANALGQLGAAHWVAGDLDRALDHFARALAALETARGESHPEVAQLLLNLAGVEIALGREDDARAHVERACAFYEATSGPESESTARCLHDQAVVEHNAGAHTEAEPLSARALSILRRILPVEHPEVVRSIRLSAEIAEAMGDREAALRGWAEVLALLERTGARPSDLGDARFGVARLRFSGRGGPEDEAAVAMARAAHAELVADEASAEAADVKAWLGERGVSVADG
jgi:tetratricopeptide (TPR) repeat protein